MADIKLQVSDEGYRIRVGDEFSEVAEFGEPVEATIGGKHYVAFADLPSGAADSVDIESALKGWVYEATDVLAEVEEVDDFDEDEDDEDDEDEDDEDAVVPDGGEEEEEEEESNLTQK
jgi:hypothetical protein